MYPDSRWAQATTHEPEAELEGTPSLIQILSNSSSKQVFGLEYLSPLSPRSETPGRKQEREKNWRNMILLF